MKMIRKITIMLGVVVLTASLLTPINSKAADPTFKLSAKGGCGYVALAWDAFKGADGYWIYRGTEPGKENDMPLTDFPIKALEYKDENDIENNTQYCYIVKAVNTMSDIIATSNESCTKTECNIDDTEIDIPYTNCKLEMKFVVGDTNYWVNGALKGKLSAAPELVQGRVALPIRKMCDEIGAKLEWNDATKTASILAADGTKLEMQINNPMAKINGIKSQLDPNNKKVVPYISRGNTMLQMRWISENLGATGPKDITWIRESQTIILKFNDWVNCGNRRVFTGVLTKSEPASKRLRKTPDWLKNGFVLEFGDHVFYLEADMPDRSGKNKSLLGFKGAINIWTNDKGVIISWEPVPYPGGNGTESPCKKGMVVGSKTYKKVIPGPMPGKNIVIVVYSVMFIPCDTNTMITLTGANMKDAGNAWTLTDYRGCAEICYKDAEKKVTSWTVKPLDGCCPTPDCQWKLINITGTMQPDMGTGIAVSQVFGVFCNGTTSSGVANLSPTVVYDVTGTIKLLGYTGCALVCVSGTKMLKFIPWKNGKCCPPGYCANWKRVHIRYSKEIPPPSGSLFSSLEIYTWLWDSTGCNASNATYKTALNSLMDIHGKQDIRNFCGFADICLGKDGKTIEQWVEVTGWMPCSDWKKGTIKITSIGAAEFPGAKVVFKPCEGAEVTYEFEYGLVPIEVHCKNIFGYTGCAVLCYKPGCRPIVHLLPDEECCK